MILPDNKTDSLLIYCDWLEDNEQLELALEIRAELQEVNFNLYEIRCHYHSVGSKDSIFNMSFSDLISSATGNNLVGVDANFHNHVASQDNINGVGR